MTQLGLGLQQLDAHVCFTDMIELFIRERQRHINGLLQLLELASKHELRVAMRLTEGYAIQRHRGKVRLIMEHSLARLSTHPPRSRWNPARSGMIP